MLKVIISKVRNISRNDHNYELLLNVGPTLCIDGFTFSLLSRSEGVGSLSWSSGAVTWSLFMQQMSVPPSNFGIMGLKMIQCNIYIRPTTLYPLIPLCNPYPALFPCSISNIRFSHCYMYCQTQSS